MVSVCKELAIQRDEGQAENEDERKHLDDL